MLASKGTSGLWLVDDHAARGIPVEPGARGGRRLGVGVRLHDVRVFQVGEALEAVLRIRGGAAPVDALPAQARIAHGWRK